VQEILTPLRVRQEPAAARDSLRAPARTRRAAPGLARSLGRRPVALQLVAAARAARAQPVVRVVAAAQAPRAEVAQGLAAALRNPQLVAADCRRSARRAPRATWAAST